MTNLNVFDLEVEFDDDDPPGYHTGGLSVGKLAGAKDQIVKLFVLPPGQSLCPYHYEYVEEWLLVLEGTVVVRVPDGELTVDRGGLMCFPAGPDGAHKLTNPGDQPARAMMWSSSREPSVAVYPDSDKIGVWTGNDDDRFMLKRADGDVGYWVGETPGA
jgi:uncharacterized cupin superfamily protein